MFTGGHKLEGEIPHIAKQGAVFSKKLGSFIGTHISVCKIACLQGL